AFVTDGLDAGDEICLTPLETFVEGMAVVPESVELPQPSPRIPPVDPAALAAAVVTPEPVAGEPRQTAPAALAEPPRDPRPTRAAEPTFQLGAIDIERGDGVVQIRFAIDPQAPRTTFALRSPSRYVVDFADTRLAMTTRSRPVGDGGIERIRVAEHEVRGTTRVVFDLSVDRPPVWEAESDVPTLRFASESGQP
ncbi:MAG: AMIN domain-containing protein, partial [Acidobacteriota bacterium]